MPRFVELWIHLSATPLFALAATLVVYLLANAAYARLRSAPWANPVLWSVIALAGGLLATRVDYPTYFAGAQFIHFLLGPAVVALAWPLWQRRTDLHERCGRLVLAALLGGAAAAASAVALGWAVGLPDGVVLSLAPKSVRAPVAMGISEQIGGMPALSAVFAVFTGMIGALSGKYLFDAPRLPGGVSYAARGFALGTAAHGIGAARALHVDADAGVRRALPPMQWALLALLALPGLAPACDAAHTASPQFSAADCVFQNQQNPKAQPSQLPWKIWTRFLQPADPAATPVDPIPVHRLSRTELDALDPAANHVMRLGHSSFLLKLRGSWWLIDPVFGERVSPFSFAGPKRFHPPPLALDELPPIEGLFLSHDHYDHLDQPTIEHLRQRVQRYFVPLGVGQRLRDMGVAAERIQEFDWWQGGAHAGVAFHAVPAQHFSGRTLWDRNRTLWAGWVIESGGQRIAYTGDSGYFDGFKQIGERFGSFDLALMENGAYDSYWPSVHMSPEETVQAFRDLRARQLYLVHNSTFNLAFHAWAEPMERVAVLAAAQGLPLATPVIGEVLTVGAQRRNLLWWRGLK